MGQSIDGTQQSREEWMRESIVIPAGESFLTRIRTLVQHAEQNVADLARVGLPSGPDSYAEVVAKIQQNLIWDLANASLDNLTSTAYQADRVRLTPVAQAPATSPQMETQS